MKKTLLGMGAVISFLFLLGSCSSAANSSSSNDDDKSKDTTNEKANLYRSAFGEYTNYGKDKEFSIEEDTFMFEGVSYIITQKTDLYYLNELPAEKSFEGKYTLTNGYGIVPCLYLKTIVGQEDNDTLSLTKWMEHYYFEEEDFEAHNTYSYAAEQENAEWYQLLSSGFYDCDNDVFYKKTYELYKYHPSSYYSKALYLCPQSTNYIFGIYYDVDGKLSSLCRFEAKRIAENCIIKKIADYKKDRLKKTDAAYSWSGLEDAEGNFYNIIDPLQNTSELEELVAEAFAEEIEASGLTADDWEYAHRTDWDKKKEEIRQYYLNKIEELEKEEIYEGIIEESWAVYPKNSGSANNGNDDDNDDSGDSSISASDFEGITWKYSHEGTGSTTTQNVEFNYGTVKVTTITASNHSSTTHTNRELSGTYTFSNGKITITYENGGYDVTADYKVSVSSNSLTLKGNDNDTSAISLLGVLFQNTSGTATITFTKD